MSQANSWYPGKYFNDWLNSFGGGGNQQQPAPQQPQQQQAPVQGVLGEGWVEKYPYFAATGMDTEIFNQLGPVAGPFAMGLVERKLGDDARNREIWQKGLDQMYAFQDYLRDSPWAKNLQNMVDNPGEYLGASFERIQGEKGRTGEQMASGLAARGMQDSGLRFDLAQRIEQGANNQYGTLVEGTRAAGMEGLGSLARLEDNVNDAIVAQENFGTGESADLTEILNTWLAQEDSRVQAEIAREGMGVAAQQSQQNAWTSFLQMLFGLAGNFIG